MVELPFVEGHLHMLVGDPLMLVEHPLVVVEAQSCSVEKACQASQFVAVALIEHTMMVASCCCSPWLAEAAY